MNKRAISTHYAPAALGPYSQAIRSGNLIFVSGQIPLDPATGNAVEGDVAAQTERVMQNLSAILEAAGSSLGHALKSTVYLKDIGDFAKMNEVYGGYFSACPPARATVEVSRLAKDVLVEIDIIAEVAGQTA